MEFRNFWHLVFEICSRTTRARDNTQESCSYDDNTSSHRGTAIACDRLVIKLSPLNSSSLGLTTQSCCKFLYVAGSLCCLYSRPLYTPKLTHAFDRAYLQSAEQINDYLKENIPFGYLIKLHKLYTPASLCSLYLTATQTWKTSWSAWTTLTHCSDDGSCSIEAAALHTADDVTEHATRSMTPWLACCCCCCWH